MLPSPPPGGSGSSNRPMRAPCTSSARSMKSPTVIGTFTTCSSSRDPAAVDGEDRPGRVRRSIGRQVEQRAVELGELARTAHRRVPPYEGAPTLVVEHLLCHLAEEPAR